MNKSLLLIPLSVLLTLNQGEFTSCIDMVELARRLSGKHYHLLYSPMVVLFVQLLQVGLHHYYCLVVEQHILNLLYQYLQRKNSTCNIHQGSDLAELLKITKLIVWDEAPMCHKFTFEALDKSLKDIMHNNQPFGGKVIVFCGDFRQILPIVPRGNRSDIVHAAINA